MNFKQLLCKKLYAHPNMLLGGIVVVTIFFAAWLPRLQFDNNNFRFVPKDDPARKLNEQMAAVFGSEVPILIGIKRTYNTVSDYEFLQKLAQLDKQLEAVPLVKKIVSLTTLTHIDVQNDSVVTGKLVPDNLANTPEDLKSVTEKLKSWDMYNKSLVSDDLHSTQTLVFLDITQEQSGSPEAIAACRALMDITAGWSCPDTELFLTGIPVFNEIVNQATAHDLIVLIPIVIAIVLAVLFFSFRRFTGILLPLLTVIVSCIWAIGAMSLFGVSLSILSTVLPVILIAVGSAYGIHVVNQYFDDVAQHGSISKEQHAVQVCSAMNRVFSPVFLAALTTFAGFGSFCFTTVVPIFEFGIFASFGVLAAFIVSVTLIPAILIIRGPKNPTMRHKRIIQMPHITIKDPVDRIIAETLVIIHAHRRSIVLISLACIVFSGIGVSKLVIDNILTEYFDGDVQIIKSDAFICEQFGGSKLFNLIITAKDGADLITPRVLSAIDSFSVYAEHNIPEVGKVTSLADLIKRLNRVYNADSPPHGICAATAAVKTTDTTPLDLESDIASDDISDFGYFDEESFVSETDTPVSQGMPLSVPAESASSSAKSSTTVEMLIQKLSDAERQYAGKRFRGSDIISFLEKEINYKGASYNEIPCNPEKYGKTTQAELAALIKNYMVLLAGNAQGFVDNVYNPTTLKVNIQLRTKGQHDSEKAVTKIMEYIHTKFPPEIQVMPGGSIFVEHSLNTLVVNSQLMSLAVSLCVVFFILALYYRSFAAGIIGIIPLIISILLNFGIMGMLGIKLNIGTAMVSGFAIGIGIDYTIHYLAAYRHEYRIHGSQKDFLVHTFYGSGKAILFNAVSVGSGFAVLMLSKFNMLAELGFLIALVMATSSFASLTILPVLLGMCTPRFIRDKPCKSI